MFYLRFADEVKTPPAKRHKKARNSGISRTHANSHIHGRLLVKESGPYSHYSVCTVQDVFLRTPARRFRGSLAASAILDS